MTAEDFLNITKIEELATNLVNSYRQKIKNTGHRASGALGDSLTAKIFANDDSVVVTIDGEEYAKYLEDGTKPHFPPVDAILQWIRVKPVIPRAINGKLPTEQQLAFLIGRKISEKGTPATNLFKDTLKEQDFINKLKQTIQDEFNREIESSVEQMFWKSPYDK